MSSDYYLHAASVVSREIKVKGSRFIGEVWPVTGEHAANERLTEVRKREYNATHHCWAFRLEKDGSLFRYSDDGEPGGTAGLPIYRQIEGRELTNTLVVVTRYYGGTRLGTGGLARAYAEAAGEALDACKIIRETIRERIRIRFAYADTSPAMHTVDGFDTIIEASHYGEDTTLELAVRSSQTEAFKERLIENLAGRVTIEP